MKLPGRLPAVVPAAALILVLAAAAAPQDPVPVSPRGQAPAKPLQYELAVVLKLVPVHVVDKKGNPVLDLTRDDFSVTDNGRPVTITDFERHAVSGAAVAPADRAGAAAEPAAATQAIRPAARKFFLFFDFAYNNVRGILKSRTAALHFLDTALGPEDEVAVLTYSAVGGLAFHEYLTADHAKVRRVVEKIGHSDVKGRATEIEDQYWRLVQESPGGGAGAAIGLSFRAEAEGNRQESRSMAMKYMDKMTALARALRLVDGEKNFVLFSTGIPNSLIYGYASGNVTNRADVARASGDDVLRRRNEAMYKEFGAANCSFYAFDTRESAIATSLFAYDEQTMAMGSRAMSTAIEPTSVFQDGKSTGLNSLKRFTDLTGGKYYSNINMYQKNVGQLGALTGTYYVLGYSVNERWDGQFHEVKVEVGRRDCTVRALTGYFNPKPFAEYSDVEKQIHLFDLALNERAVSRLPIKMPMGMLAASAAGASRLALVALVPGEVTTRFAGRRVEFVALFFDAAGDVAAIVREERDIAPQRGRDMAFAAGTALAPGDYGCRLVIRDMESGLSAVASARATAGRPQPASLSLGTPLVLEPRSGCLFVCAADRKGGKAFAWADLYGYDSSIYAPVPPNGTAAAAAGLKVVVPCAAPGGGPAADLGLTASLVDAATGRRIPMTVAIAGRVARGPAEVLTLDLAAAGDVPPGAYYLHLYAGDRASGALGHATTALSVR